MVELLAPAGDLERLKVAIEYGADAVYFGGKRYSLRARASNFEMEDIAEAVQYAHQRHKKVYVTVNMIPHDSDFEGLQDYLKELETLGVDAIICASTAILSLCKQTAPKLEVHISTQQTTLNSKAIQYWQIRNADRIVLAREVTYENLERIAGKTTLPLEVFVQGAMCANFSGRCTISNMLTNRDANRGGCAQSCRWNYHLYHNDEKLDLDDETLLSFGSKDMCAADYLQRILDLNVASLKIEGRMKTKYYIANIVKGYRYLIDCYNEFGCISKEQLKIGKMYLKRAENRASFAGFYPGQPNRNGQLYNNAVTVSQGYVANVIDYAKPIATIEVRNYFKKNDLLSITNPTNEINFRVKKMIDLDGNEVEIANKPMQILKIEVPVDVDKFTFIRVVKTRK